MVKKRKIIPNWFKLLILLFILSFAYFYENSTFVQIQEFVSTGLYLISGPKSVNETLAQDIEVVFCPEQDCFRFINSELNRAKESIKCAFYELDDNVLAATLSMKSEDILVQLVIDGDYADEDSIDLIKTSNVEYVTDGTRSKFMHHKFCVIDDKQVITGSTNPTENGFNFNNNNLLLIESTFVADNYRREFEQLFNGNFGSSKASLTNYNPIQLYYSNKTYDLEVYFCPQDPCSEEIVEEIKRADEEILFATFVITQDDIERALIEKYNQGINIAGIVESRMYNAQGSRMEELDDFMLIKRDTNPKTMHHKVFVIDSEVVITGSMNPTRSGDEYNDENLLIIKNRELAMMYRQEILSLLE